MTDFPAYPAANVGVDDFKTSIGFTPSTWPVSTRLTLCNVPWDADYRDVVFFNSTTDRDTYFTSLSSTSIVLTGATYCKPNEPVKINIPYAECYTYNYLIVENPALPVGNSVTPPKLYYFIKQVSMIAPNTSQLYLQLDVWMTYQTYVTFGRCFVERGHVARHAYNYDSSTNLRVKARRYLMAPEGLDVGNAYVETYETQYPLVDTLSWTVVILSTVKLEIPNGSSASDVFGTVTNPKLKTAEGMTLDGFVCGCNCYAMYISDFLTFQNAMSDYPWISSQIISITAIPSKLTTFDWTSSTTFLPGGVAAKKLRSNYGTINSNDVDAGAITTYLSNNVSSVWSAHEKSRVWPFSFLKADNQLSQPLLLKPELFATENMHFTYFATVVSPFQRVFLMPIRYGTSQTTGNNGSQAQYTMANALKNQTVPWGDNFAASLVWQDFPQLSIVNDGYLQYLAGNAHGLTYQRDYAGWALDKSLAASKTSYDNANRSLGAASQNQQLAYETQRDISRLSMGNLVGNQLRDVYNNLSAGTQGGINSVFGGADVSAIINTTVNAATGATANEVGNLQFQTSRQAQQGNIDANYQLQQWAARGDYEQTIAGINATVQDAQLTPPNQSGTFGGGMMAVLGSKGLLYWWLKAYTVNVDYQHKISDFWNRFGYAVGEYVSLGRKFCLMTNYTYWKCQDTTLSSSVGLEEGVKDAIRGIFEKGVTVWGSASNIGSDITSITNAPSNTYATTPLY